MRNATDVRIGYTGTITTGLIAFQNLSIKFNGALDIPPQGFCVRPHRGFTASLKSNPAAGW